MAVAGRIVTTSYCYKRPAKKRKAVALQGPAIVTRATSPRRKPAPDAPSPANDHAPAKPAPAAAKPAIATSISRKRARLQRAETAAEPEPDDPEADAAMRAWIERAKGARAGMTDDALPTPPRSIPHGYDVSAWCRACQHTVRLDLPALVASGHGDVPLIHLPLRCRCGSDQFGVVGAVSTGKWQSAPSG